MADTNCESNSLNPRMLKPMDDMLRCRICSGFLDNCLLTACSHNFCSVCIRIQLTTDTDCPICYEEVKESDLRNNKIMDKMVRIYKKMTKTADTSQHQPPSQICPPPQNNPQASRSAQTTSSDIVVRRNNSMEQITPVIHTIQAAPSTNVNSVEQITPLIHTIRATPHTNSTLTNPVKEEFSEAEDIHMEGDDDVRALTYSAGDSRHLNGMMKNYSVVGFLPEQGQPVEVIPSSWVLNSRNCWWPGEKDKNKLQAMIRNCARPNPEWHLLPIKLYGNSSNYANAIKKAEKENRINNGKRVAKKPKRYHDSSSSEEEEESSMNQTTKIKRIINNGQHTLLKPPQEHMITSMNTVNHEDEFILPVISEVETANYNEFTDQHLDPLDCSFDVNTASTEESLQETVLERVLRHVIEIKRENKLLRKEMRSLCEKVKLRLEAETHPTAIAAINDIVHVQQQFENLPLTNMIDLQDLESEISSDASKATSLARFLCRGGSFKSFNSLTILIMKRLLGRSIAMQFSVEGRQSKLKFSDLNLLNVVVASVKMKYKDAELSTITSRIGKLLCGAADWDGNRTRGKRKSKQMNAENS